MAIIAQACAKINWGLNITRRREDGYHELDMLMHRIALSDALRIEPAGEITLTVNGASPGDPEANLVVRAARALNRRAGTRHGARLSLEKRIPARAGLGGGSADCAATLMALNGLWGLDFGMDVLMEIGASLGADVPFCLAGGLAQVSGIGEVIRPVPGAPEIPLVLVTPGGGLSTAEVFRLWDAGGFPPVSLDTDILAEAVVRRDLAAVDGLAQNALLAPAVRLMPEISACIGRMRVLGAKAAFMTGSGSTVVGAFDDPATARNAAWQVPGAILTHTLAE